MALLRMGQGAPWIIHTTYRGEPQAGSYRRRKVLVVVTALVGGEPNVLLLRDRATNDLTCICGGVKARELCSDAAAREVREETREVVDPAALLESAMHFDLLNVCNYGHTSKDPHDAAAHTTYRVYLVDAGEVTPAAAADMRTRFHGTTCLTRDMQENSDIMWMPLAEACGARRHEVWPFIAGILDHLA